MRHLYTIDKADGAKCAALVMRGQKIQSLGCLLSYLSFVTLTIGCSSLPVAAVHEDKTAKNFAPVADKAIVYLYQTESGGGFEIIVDGKEAGSMGARAYFRFELHPGEHTISSRWGGEPNIFIHKITLDAGKLYYIEHEWHLRVLAPPQASFEEKSEIEGKASIKKCKLLENLF